MLAVVVVIGKTCRHFKTRIQKHIKKDSKSDIFKHLNSTATCFDSYNSYCFKIIDKTNSKFNLKIKEVLPIKCTTKSFSSDPFTIASAPRLVYFCPCFCCCCFFFSFLFYLLFSLSLTLITGIFYYLNYTSLLFHLITTHLVSDLSLSSIIFIISTLIIGIFYCLNYTSLLLHLIITHLVIDFIITM